MDLNKLITRCHQFGGFRLIWEYTKLGVLFVGVMNIIRCLVKRQSFKVIYPEILCKIEPFLIKKYSPILQYKKEDVRGKTLEHKRSEVIWFCWLQGLNEAPETVHVCYESLKRHLPDKEIKVIDNFNWREFVELPEYLVKKWEKGRIPAAIFSDLLRLELLIKYGGTWIDSSVLCTGFGTQITQKAQIFLDCDLFLFQYTPEGTMKGISISNWFITSCTNNEVLMAVRDMLYTYWKDYDCTLDYYMFHLFFEMVAREFPEQVGAMPYGSSQRSIALMRHWNEKFDQEQWDRLVSRVAFHKLSCRVPDEVKKNKNNYYTHMINL